MLAPPFAIEPTPRQQAQFRVGLRIASAGRSVWMVSFVIAPLLSLWDLVVDGEPFLRAVTTCVVCILGATDLKTIAMLVGNAFISTTQGIRGFMIRRGFAMFFATIVGLWSVAIIVGLIVFRRTDLLWVGIAAFMLTKAIATVIGMIVVHFLLRSEMRMFGIE